MKRSTLVVWLTVNAAALVGLPVWFAHWISAEVKWEYANGYRTSTDGDSIGIPIMGFTLMLVVALVLLNAIVFGVLWWRRSRQRRAL